jgi:tetratricopeptide (TPR) repeat protein
MASTSDSNTHYNPNVLRGRDGFFSSVYRFFDALSKHRGAMAGAIVGVVVVGVAVGVTLNRKEEQGEAGKNALFLAQKAYETEMKTVAGVKELPPAKPPVAAKDGKDAKDANASKAQQAASEAADKARAEQEKANSKLLEDTMFAKLDVDAKFPETIKKYKGVIDQYGGTRAGFEARMALGSLYYNHGEAGKAIAPLQAATESAPGSFEKSLAFSALGYANENAGKPQEAVAAYEKALGAAGAQAEAVKGDLLLAIARSYEALKDSAKARSTYDRIISELPNSDAAKTAESLKTQL